MSTNNAAPAGTFCAVEGQRCSFSGTANVTYGANGRFVTKAFTNGVDCSNAVFGDPIYGVGKRCFYTITSTISSPVSTNNAAPAGTFCAVEGQRCSFSGTANVTYGANGRFVTKAFTNGVDCSNAVFGDPIYGVGKRCFYTAVGQSASREGKAVSWAVAQANAGSTDDSGGWCDRFVAKAFGRAHSGYATAWVHYEAMRRAGAIHAERDVPAGALAFFDRTSKNGQAGHVAISVGGGNFVSSDVGANGGRLVASGRAGYTSIPAIEASSGSYLGWAWAENSWAGR